jgi:hypothetical protein
MQSRESFLIVYSSAGNVYYQVLARRLATAFEELSQEARLCAATELSDMDAGELADTTLMLVNPVDCAYKISDRAKFFSRVSAAQKRIMVLAEAAGTRWLRGQFKLGLQFGMPIRYDALFDVGFVSQAHSSDDLKVPYRFLFNGPTRQEEAILKRPTLSQRPIPWAIVGHKTDGRVGLVEDLMERFDPGGLVFLSRPGSGLRKGEGSIGPSGLASALSRTRYYVWISHHEFMYYESFRFVEAILVGAVPCKIDERAEWNQLGIPGIFPSVGAFIDTVHNEGFSSMQAAARTFYLSQGNLAYNLEKVLEDV